MKTQLEQESRIIGFREWVGLPKLGLFGIKAKVDTGAKTSCLHAFDIKVEERVGKKSIVRFKVHPLQNETHLVINCEAILVDKRVVTDSGGHKESRLVIETVMVLGNIKKKIELTLTNRESMKYRMLIGRSALGEFYIDPTQSYLAGKSIKQKNYLKDLKRRLNEAP
ncbi:MAG: ATP-dependent zinc protease [Bacteriovoracaceae bacterium]